MKNLLIFLTKYNHWFLLAFLEIVSMVLLFRFNSYQGSVYFTQANVVSGKILEWDSNVRTFFSLGEVNEQLTQRNLELERQVSVLTHQLEATKKVQKADPGQMALIKQFRYVPAKVIGNSVDKKDNLITLDKGSRDGVRKDMGVVCGNGVVGIVYMVSGHYSIVIPVLNSLSAISVKVQGTDYFGYLHWEGGSIDEAWVENVPMYDGVKPGNKVVTSGYSAIFPPGVLAGTVMKVEKEQGGMCNRLKVKLSTDFGNLRDVCVVDNRAMEERIRLMRATQDSLKNVVR